jgi:hypothetical protein
MPLSKQAAYSKDQRIDWPKLQHRHFAFLARVISRLPADIRQEVANEFASVLPRTNDNFDRERFILASGVELIEADKAAKEYEEIVSLAGYPVSTDGKQFDKPDIPEDIFPGWKTVEIK